MIYFTSDFHLFHDLDSVYKNRGFDNAEKMSHKIIENLNKTVNKDDTLYVLGDLILTDDEKGLELLSLINCEDIHIILGNHDSESRIKKYSKLKNVKEIVYATKLKYGRYLFYLSHYPAITNYLTDKHLKGKLISLCGHTHTDNRFLEMEEKKILSYHVEVDAHNLYPISIDYIIEDIKEYLNNNYI